MMTNRAIHDLAENAYKTFKGKRIGYSVRWERRKADGSMMHPVIRGQEYKQEVETDCAGYMNKRDAYKLAVLIAKDGYTGVQVYRNDVRNGADDSYVRFSLDWKAEPTEPTEPTKDTACDGGCGKMRSILYSDSPVQWMCYECAQNKRATVEPTVSNLLDSIAELCTVETRTKILCSSWNQANSFCNQLVNIDSTLNPKISTVNGHYSVTFIQSK